MIKYIIILLSITFLLGCSTDEEYKYSDELLANEQINPFWNSFREEASSRGLDLSDNEIDFYLADIENEVGGLSYKDGKIIIDRENWNNGTPEYKEWLVFHELGHSILGRNHRNEKTNSGECLSFMNGTESDFSCSKNLYSALWKDYYLDELFDQSTELPNWYTEKNNYNLNIQGRTDIISKTTQRTEFYTNSINLESLSNYVIEVTFENWATALNNSSDANTMISFNGNYFNSSPNSERNVIIIKEGIDKRLFQKDRFDFGSDIKFTIRNHENVFQFFINETFLHATDINSFSSDNLIISFSSEIDLTIELYKYSL